MENFLKDRYSIAEAVDLISQKKEHLSKEDIREYFLGQYGVKVVDLAWSLKQLPGCHDYGLEQALGRFEISREEVLRHDEHLTRYQTEEAVRPKKRGRRESRDLMQDKIEAVLSCHKGKKYSQAQMIDFVAKVLDKSPSTLKRHYKKSFSEWKRGAKNR